MTAITRDMFKLYTTVNYRRLVKCPAGYKFKESALEVLAGVSTSDTKPELINNNTIIRWTESEDLASDFTHEDWVCIFKDHIELEMPCKWVDLDIENAYDAPNHMVITIKPDLSVAGLAKDGFTNLHLYKRLPNSSKLVDPDKIPDETLRAVDVGIQIKNKDRPLVMIKGIGYFPQELFLMKVPR